MQVGGNDMPLFADGGGDLKRLAAGRGTGVEYRLARLRVKEPQGGERRGVLNRENPFAESWQVADADAMAEDYRGRIQRVDVRRNALRDETGGKGLGLCGVGEG